MTWPPGRQVPQTLETHAVGEDVDELIHILENVCKEQHVQNGRFGRWGGLVGGTQSLSSENPLRGPSQALSGPSGVRVPH
jgi:hypothetical protein